MFCLVCKCVTLVGTQVSVQGSCVSLWCFEALAASEICSSCCVIAVAKMFWVCASGGWQKGVLLPPVPQLSRSVPPRNWVLCSKQMIQSWLVIQARGCQNRSRESSSRSRPSTPSFPESEFLMLDAMSVVAVAGSTWQYLQSLVSWAATGERS